jgi:hypothetical protein
MMETIEADEDFGRSLEAETEAHVRAPSPRAGA